jgi:hypothetical protein
LCSIITYYVSKFDFFRKKNLGAKTTSKCYQLFKLKIFHGGKQPDLEKNYHNLYTIIKKNIREIVIIKLLFFTSFKDSLDHNAFKRSLINHYTAMRLLLNQGLPNILEPGFTGTEAYKNTILLIALYSLYKIKYEISIDGRN